MVIAVGRLNCAKHATQLWLWHGEVWQEQEITSQFPQTPLVAYIRRQCGKKEKKKEIASIKFSFRFNYNLSRLPHHQPVQFCFDELFLHAFKERFSSRRLKLVGACADSGYMHTVSGRSNSPKVLHKSWKNKSKSGQHVIFRVCGERLAESQHSAISCVGIIRSLRKLFIFAHCAI